MNVSEAFNDTAPFLPNTADWHIKTFSSSVSVLDTLVSTPDQQLEILPSPNIFFVDAHAQKLYRSLKRLPTVFSTIVLLFVVVMV